LKNLGIIIFDNVEDLDFTGPLEVFGTTSHLKPNSLYPFTIQRDGREVKTVNGLRVRPDYSFQECPRLDILLVPGGMGTRTEMKDPETLEFVKRNAVTCELVLSVCTGALVLAAAGILNGKRATTHWAVLDQLKAFPHVTVDQSRYVRDGKIVTSAGVSAGIDMALYITKELYGASVCEDVARDIEYPLCSV
jgi:transcriptional regulator GlxA family with amidase domain